jgi:hypothetical protein
LPQSLDPLGLMSQFDSTWLLLSLIPSAVGFVLFMYGKKRDRVPHKIAGVLYMVYPIVTTTVTSLLIGGGLISLGLWYAIRADW